MKYSFIPEQELNDNHEREELKIYCPNPDCRNRTDVVFFPRLGTCMCRNCFTKKPVDFFAEAYDRNFN